MSPIIIKHINFKIANLHSVYFTAIEEISITNLNYHNDRIYEFKKYINEK